MSAVPPSTSINTEVLALHAEAMKLKTCPNLKDAVKVMSNKVTALLKSKDFEPFKIGLKDVQRRLSGIYSELEQDEKARVALDCHGIGVKIRSVFKQKVPEIMKGRNQAFDNFSFFERGGGYETFFEPDEYERFILENDFDVNQNRTTLTKFLTSVLDGAGVQEDRLLAVIRNIIRAGAELNTTDQLRPPLYVVLGHFFRTYKEPLTKLLVENGVDPNQLEGEFVKRHHPLPIWMAKFKEENDLIPLTVIAHLVDAHMDVNMTVKKNPSATQTTTPLNEHLKEGHKKRSQYLVAAGAPALWSKDTVVSEATAKLLEKTAAVREEVLVSYPNEPRMIVTTLHRVEGLKEHPDDVLNIIENFGLLKPSELCDIILDKTNAK